MRVVLYDPYTHGHHLKYASYLIDRLLRDGYEVMFVTRKSPQADWLLKKYQKLFLKRVDRPSLKNAVRLSNKWRADVLHILYTTSFLPLLLHIHKKYSFKIFVTIFWLISIIPHKQTRAIEMIRIKMNQFAMLAMLRMKWISGIIFHSVYPSFTKKILFSNVRGLIKYHENLIFLYDPSDDVYYNEYSKMEARKKIKIKS